jgi:hypothetical protein
MGCNFYTLRGKHIGKRSAAGMYCWDCGVPLNKEGEKGVHKSHSENCKHKGSLVCDCLVLKQCPKCGKKIEKEKFENSSVARELGFNKNKPSKKTGVKSCSSFSWAISPSKLNKYLFLKDEYGRIISRSTFEKEILSECPIQFTDLVKREFC